MTAVADDWLATICAGTEMGSLVLAKDWANTPLGSPETWSRGLRTAVGVCLTSRFPMLVVWGPELVQIYNDGYRPILGTEKHPQALGSPAKALWGEVWDVIGPDFDQVMQSGVPTWHEHEKLVLERNGYPEEGYFVWSYSPLFDDDGTIAGVLDTVRETTEMVISRRRLNCITEVSADLFGSVQVTDVCLRATSTLRTCSDDVTAADIYLRIGNQLPLVASNRRGQVPPVNGDVVEAVSVTGQPVVLGGELGANRPADHLVVPVDGGHGGISGVMVASLHPERPLDDDYVEFVSHIARLVGAALESAYRRAVEVDTYRSISDTLQNAMLTPVRDFPTVAARYVPAVGRLSVGGDWYDVIDLDDHRRGLVVGDCVGHGLDAATAMGQLRSAARAMLIEEKDPAEVLAALDRFAASTDNAFGATVACAVIDRSDGSLTYARAGHPPPLLIGPKGCKWLDGPGGPPLATVDGAQRLNHVVPLVSGDVVVLYTDGLVERRGEVLDEGMARLQAATQAAYGAPVHQMADSIMRDLVVGDASDDVVLVVKRLEA
jgi:serine phosphatase RsbU (regulator of sigma subunit)